MQVDPEHYFFTERGISPETVLARGYVMWNGDDFNEVIEEAFSSITAKQQGSVDWLKKKAREASDGAALKGDPVGGIIITRYSPIDLVDDEGNAMVMVPEIRPNVAVESGMPNRHYHGPEVHPLTLIPSIVEEVHVRSEYGRQKRYNIKFQHNHQDIDIDEMTSHHDLWHSGTPTSNPVNASHRHVLQVHEAINMNDHIHGFEDKMTNQHEGENHLGVHKHVGLAKYLFAPSEKEEKNWNESPHNHGRMSASQLDYHIRTYHNEGGDEE